MSDPGQATTALASSNVDVTSKKAACHASVDDRSTPMGNVEGLVAEGVRQAYANPAVTSATIEARGPLPRSTSRAKVFPQTPTVSIYPWTVAAPTLRPTA